MCWKEISEIVHNFGVGLGTLFAGGGGFVLFWTWNEERVKKYRFYKIKTAYPRVNLKKINKTNATFQLLRAPSEGRIYIYDLYDKKLRWIETWETFIKLGYNKEDWDEIKDEEVKDYLQGDNILAP